MENIIVTRQGTFEELMARFNRLAGVVNRFCRRAEEKRLGEWLSSTEVCQILQIGPRTLQALRNNGMLTYSRIVRRMFYRAEDMRHIVPLVEERHALAALKGKTI